MENGTEIPGLERTACVTYEQRVPEGALHVRTPPAGAPWPVCPEVPVPGDTASNMGGLLLPCPGEYDTRPCPLSLDFSSRNLHQRCSSLSPRTNITFADAGGCVTVMLRVDAHCALTSFTGGIPPKVQGPCTSPQGRDVRRARS